MSAPVDADVFVIGAGPAGLSAAYSLSGQAQSVVVAERDPHAVGGLARTLRFKDFRFGIAGSLHPSGAPEAHALWNGLLPGGFALRQPRTRSFDGKRFHAPTRTPAEALRRLPPVSQGVCLASYVLARAIPMRDPRSLRDQARNRYGDRLFRTLFAAYCDKVWGLPSAELAADCALDAWAADDPVLHCLEGPGAVWTAAADGIRAHGGQVLMGRTLRRLTFDAAAKIWRIEVAAATTVETFTARHVISSAPVRDLIACLAGHPVSTFHARALRYRDLVTVALVRRGEPLADTTIQVNDAALKVSHVQNYAMHTSDNAAPVNVIGLEYFCFEGDDIWRAPDTELSLPR